MGQLSPNSMQVNGTGQTVGDLKNIGYNQGQISQLGTTPNIWQNLVKGGATGLANGLQNYGSAQGNMGGMSRRTNNPYFYGYGQGQ